MPETDNDIPTEKPAFDLSAFDAERMYTIHPVLFGWIVLVFTFLSYQIVGGIIAYLVTGGDAAGHVTETRLLTMVSQLLFLLAPALVLVKMQPWSYPKLLSLRRASLSQVLLGIFAVAAIQIPIQGYIRLQDHVVRQWLLPDSLLPYLEKFEDMLSGMYGTIATAYTPLELGLVLLVVAITPALCEELLFRGIVFGSFRRKLQVWPAIILSGLAFGLFHLNPITFIPLSGLGILLAWLTYKSSSILPAMIAHAANNTIAIISLYFLKGADSVLVTETQQMDYSALLTASVLSLIVFAVVVVMFRNTARPQHLS